MPRIGPEQMLLHYRMVSEIGAGGMGVVWEAVDTTLDRKVAIKILPADFAADPGRLARFEREARLLASLDHPNIAVVHGLHEDRGLRFLAMELVSGEDLATRLSRGPLVPDAALRIADQVADALESTHRSGVVHRDLKPANIRIDRRGRVKVLDFGLAKGVATMGLGPELTAAPTVTAGPTEAGAVLGTAAYMSPEQARGRAVDARTDIWAFGCVLYEMLSGTRAFRGATFSDCLAAVLTEEPDLDALPASPEIRELIARCLAKDAPRRLDDIAVARATIAAALQSAVASPLPARVAAAQREVRAVAVLPLANLSGDPDQEYFVAGMHDALINQLARIKALKVISRTSVARFKETERSIPEIALELGVDTLVEGSVLKAGDEVRINVQLVAVEPERNLWAETYDRHLRDVLALHREVAGSVARAVRVAVGRGELQVPEEAPTVDPVVYDLYLKGRHLAHTTLEQDVERAIEHFRRAIELDAGHAPSHAALARSLSWLALVGRGRPATCFPAASSAAARAMELDDDLAEAHAVRGHLALVWEHDWPRARRELGRSLDLQPNSVTALTDLALAETAAVRHEEAERLFDRALELDPLSPFTAMIRAWSRYMARRHDEAAALYDLALELDPRFPPLAIWRAVNLADLGRHDEAASACLEIEAAFPGLDAQDLLSALGYVYGTSGRAEQARRVVERLTAPAPGRWVDPARVAAIEGAIREPEAGLASLRRAFEESSPILFLVRASPIWDPLRAAEGFDELLREATADWHFE